LQEKTPNGVAVIKIMKGNFTVSSVSKRRGFMIYFFKAQIFLSCPNQLSESSDLVPQKELCFVQLLLLNVN